MFREFCLLVMGIFVVISGVMTITDDTWVKRLLSFIQLCTLSAVLYYVWFT